MLYSADTCIICAMQQLVQQMCKQVYDTFLKLQALTIAKPKRYCTMYADAENGRRQSDVQQMMYC